MSETVSPPLDPAYYADRSGVIIAAVTVALTVTTACVCLRTYARAVMLRQFGLDDWAAIIAVLFAIGCGISMAAGACAFLSPVNPRLTTFSQVLSTVPAVIWPWWTHHSSGNTFE
jgi:hypothetical protein